MNMPHGQIPEILLEVDRIVRRARGRIGRQAWIDNAVAGLALGALAAAGAIVLWRLIGLGQSLSILCLALAPVGAVVWSLLRKPEALDDYRIAKHIDLRFDLHEQFAGGYHLLQRALNDDLPKGPFTELILEDVETAVGKVDIGTLGSISAPRSLLAAAAALIVAAALPFLIFPGQAQVDVTLAISKEDRKQLDKINKTIANAANAIESRTDLSAAEKDDLLKKFDSLTITKDQMEKMSKKDLIRKAGELGVMIKSQPEGEGAAVSNIISGQLEAALAKEQIEKQAAEIDQMNSKDRDIDLGGGKAAKANKVVVKSSEVNFDLALAKATGGPDQAQLDIEAKRAKSEAEALEKKARNQKFKKRGSITDAPKRSGVDQMISNDKDMQTKVLAAVKDPNSQAAKDMKRVYGKSMEAEIRNEGLPKGIRDSLGVYMESE
jgi:hypothetical protein